MCACVYTNIHLCVHLGYSSGLYKSALENCLPILDLFTLKIFIKHQSWTVYSTVFWGYSGDTVVE